MLLRILFQILDLLKSTYSYVLLVYLKMLYLGHFEENQKTKGTLLSQTFKVEESNVVLFFHFEQFLNRYDEFVFFEISKFSGGTNNGVPCGYWKKICIFPVHY